MMDEIDLELCLNVEQYNQTPPSTGFETNMALPMHHSHPPTHDPNHRIRKYDDFRADRGLETEHLHDLPNAQHPPTKRTRTSSTNVQACFCDNDPRDPSEPSNFHPNLETPTFATQIPARESDNTAPGPVNDSIHTEGYDAPRETRLTLPPMERVNPIERVRPLVSITTGNITVRSSLAPTPTPTRKSIFTIYEDAEAPDFMDLDPPSAAWASPSPDDDKENEEDEEELELFDEERVDIGRDESLSWEEEYRVAAQPQEDTEHDAVDDVDGAYQVAGTGYDSIAVSSSWASGSARARGRRRSLPR